MFILYGGQSLAGKATLLVLGFQGGATGFQVGEGGTDSPLLPLNATPPLTTSEEAKSLKT